MPLNETHFLSYKPSLTGPKTEEAGSPEGISRFAKAFANIVSPGDLNQRLFPGPLDDMLLKFNGDGRRVLVQELPDGRTALAVQVVCSLRAQYP